MFTPHLEGGARKHFAALDSRFTGGCIAQPVRRERAAGSMNSDQAGSFLCSGVPD